ncbi:PspC domain-containing protein [Xylocopilactobacillus apis]|uniref:Phage shock protein PspC N-terminal domain-containing protein n=1 Tax=Xylocopilactobacillus apis TaxID=2932183 RepID=A0AAU9D0Z9_9LACO|nr:PspC domain-containing protein [Xylocopilactobacillus apis]BDR57223.1 hypothetical protein KIMC2_17850 [Xylocopilactobacillus apis]
MIFLSFIVFICMIVLLLPFILAAFIGRLLGLYKSSDDRVLAGVCAGVADRFDVSPGLVRLIWLIAVLFFSVGFWWYVAFAIVLPTERHDSHYDDF